MAHMAGGYPKSTLILPPAWTSGVITIPVVVVNDVVQNIYNTLFISIEEKQLQTYFFLLLHFCD